jgi:hypothetical protein
MRKVILKPGNIWSGNRQLAVLTNPTELAKKKGNLRQSYPVIFKQEWYADAESAYQAHKADTEDRYQLMVHIIACKLERWTEVFEAIKRSGGEEFIANCNHIVFGKSWWEGRGLESPFIRALRDAYRIIDNL